MRRAAHTALSVLFGLQTAAAADVNSAESKALSSHFDAQHLSVAHERKATALPAAAAFHVLHLDLAIFSDASSPGDLDAAFVTLVRHETTFAAADAKVPHALCGPARQSEAARAALAEFHPRPPVIFASRKDDVACWAAHLTLFDAEVLKSSPAFFHVTAVPAVAKLAPRLVRKSLSTNTTSSSRYSLSPASDAFVERHQKNGGLSVRLRRDTEAPTDAASLASQWEASNFGFTTGDGDSGPERRFSPTTLAKHSPSWKAVHVAVSFTDCSSHLIVSASPKSGREIRVQLVRRGIALPTLEDHCALDIMVFLASQPEVETVEIAPVVKLQVVHSDDFKPSSLDRTFVLPEEGANQEREAQKHSRPRILNSVAVTALQSGTVGSNPLWEIGVNGTGQFVQVL